MLRKPASIGLARLLPSAERRSGDRDGLDVRA